MRMSIARRFELIVEQVAKLTGLEVDCRSHVDEIELYFRDSIYKHCQSKCFVSKSEIYSVARIEDLASNIVRMAANKIKELIKKEKESDGHRMYISTGRGSGKTLLNECISRGYLTSEDLYYVNNYIKKTLNIDKEKINMIIKKNDIKDVIFNPPATIVMWKDGTKTVVKAQNDEFFDPEKGLAMAITKKALGNQGNYFETIKKYTEKYKEKENAEHHAEDL